MVSDILLSGFSKGIPFQPSMIRSEEAPMPSAKRPPDASADRRRLLREQCPTTLHHPDHAGPEADLIGPGGGQCQRGEAIGSVGLARPEVRVAGRLGAPEEVGVLGQRQAGEWNGQSPALRHTATLYIREGAPVGATSFDVG